MRKILLFSLVVMIMASSFVFADNNYIMANFGYRAGTTFSGMDFNVDWIGYFGGGGSSSGSQPSGGLFSGLFQSSASQTPERYTPEYYTPHEYQATSSASLFGHGLGSASAETSGKSGTIGMHVGLSLGSVKAYDWNYDSYESTSSFNMGLQLGASFRQFLFGGDFFLYEHAGIEVGYPNMMFGVYGDVGPGSWAASPCLPVRGSASALAARMTPCAMTERRHLASPFPASPIPVLDSASD